MGKVDFLEASWPTGVRSTLAGWFTDLQGFAVHDEVGMLASMHPAHNHRKLAAEMELLVITARTSMPACTRKVGNVVLQAGGLQPRCIFAFLCGGSNRSPRIQRQVPVFLTF